MSWKYAPDRFQRAHWFETDAHWSLCGKVRFRDEWIDDRGGTRNDCRSCERLIMLEANK